MGKTSVLTLHLEHPIHLDGDYRLALIGFYSDNNINNLLKDAYVYFKDVHEPLKYTRGYWTIEKLQSRAREYLGNFSVNANSFKIEKRGDRVSIFSPLMFNLDSTASELLGFKPKITSETENYFEAEKAITALNPPNLRGFDVIEIQCNIVEHSYACHDVHTHKHAEAKILYQFFPNVPRGYKISEVPREKLYVPISSGVQRIQQIVITIKGHDNQLIQNEHVNNIVYLELVHNRH